MKVGHSNIATNSDNCSNTRNLSSQLMQIESNEDDEALTSHIVEIIVATFPPIFLEKFIPRESLVKLSSVSETV